jgi:hypothetical protein
MPVKAIARSPIGGMIVQRCLPRDWRLNPDAPAPKTLSVWSEVRLEENIESEPTAKDKHRSKVMTRPLASFHKKPLIIVSYATACAIVVLGMAYWPASAGSVLTKLNVLPAHLTSAPDISNRIHKADKRSNVSFEERWSVVPSPSAVFGGDKNWREARRAERSVESIPFSCELAFSRLVTKGNFSTRCIAGLEISKTDT